MCFKMLFIVLCYYVRTKLNFHNCSSVVDLELKISFLVVLFKNSLINIMFKRMT